MKKYNWGILGCGRIAGSFATGLQSIPEAELMAVGSRSQSTADEFANRFDAPNRHASYEALVADPDVDIIYVATPHPMHAENCLLALSGGKPVLCEKPFTINAGEARSVANAARARGLFLMEGMWSRFFPLMRELKRLVDDGAIGAPKLLQADFGFHADFDPRSRLFDPALGGGALLDVGVYCVSLSSMLFGAPEAVSGVAHIGTTGIDEQCTMTLRHAKGQVSVLSTAITANTPQEIWVCGDRGRIKVHTPWWRPTSLTLWQDGHDPREISMPYTGNGFNYEAEAAMSCLDRGDLESPVIPVDESISIMQTMDTLRAHWGVRYPGEL